MFPPGISYYNSTHPRTLVDANEAPQHQRPVGCPGWASLVHTIPKLSKNLPLANTCYPKLRQTVLQAYGFYPPPGPSSPDSRRATVVTVASVMSTGTISGSLPLNISRLCTNDGWASGCFDRRTSKTGSHVLGNVSSVWSTPPFSLSEIHRTSNIKGFPALFHRGAVTTVSQHIVHLVSSYALGCPYYTPMDPYLIQ